MLHNVGGVQASYKAPLKLNAPGTNHSHAAPNTALRGSPQTRWRENGGRWRNFDARTGNHRGIIWFSSGDIRYLLNGIMQNHQAINGYNTTLIR